MLQKMGKGCPLDEGNRPCSANILVYCLELYLVFLRVSILFSGKTRASTHAVECYNLAAHSLPRIGKNTKMQFFI